MAKTTGNTIAGLWRFSGQRSAPLWLHRGGLLLLTLHVSTFGSVGFGAGPAGKSRYRTATHGQGDAGTTDPAGSDSTGNHAAAAAQSDPSPHPFALKSLLGVKSNGETVATAPLLDALPMERLTPLAKQRLAAITTQPTLYRRLPTQAIRCDEELLLFLTRKPESIIGIWDLMGITNVQATRIGPYELDAVDGSGTSCKIDLLYGDRNLHVFIADGMYDGKFVQKPIVGKGVFVFKSIYAQSSDGSTTVTGMLDCYIKFESLGADIIARSLGGLIGKSADHNYVETAKFISQISQACEKNPDGMLEMIDRMPQVDVHTKSEFSRIVFDVSQRYQENLAPAAKLVQDRGITPTPH